MPTKLDTAGFVRRARARHSDRYDYSQTRYEGTRHKVIIGCPVHGAFEQTPNAHLNGNGCPVCGASAPTTATRLTYTAFVTRARTTHGSRYDYSQVAYVNNATQISITCHVHGVFKQTPANHLKGQGCPACAIQARSTRTSADRLTAFLQQAHTAHGDKYDYSQVVYINNATSVTIGCPAHGVFEQKPYVHVQGMGCAACGVAMRASARRIGKPYFLEKAYTAHGSRYDYRDTQVDGQEGKARITCTKHGVFEQSIRHHMQGHGCPSCASHISKPNNEIAAFLQSLGVQVELEASIPGQQKQRIDIFLPLLGIAIEYHGLRWHSTAVMDETTARWKHHRKRMACEAAGQRYIAIYEDEWRERRALCEQFLLNVVGKAPRLQARKLRLATPTSAEARAFYNKHHFLSAGQCGTRHAGLYDASGQLVACMSFGKSTEHRGKTFANQASLTRYATAGYAIPGAAQRLFKALVQEGETVVSYIDHDKFSGQVYTHLGFKPVATIPPDYWTIWGDRQRRHKTATKRDNLAKFPSFDPAATEFQNCDLLGVHRIYHSGRSKVIYTP